MFFSTKVCGETKILSLILLLFFLLFKFLYLSLSFFLSPMFFFSKNQWRSKRSPLEVEMTSNSIFDLHWWSMKKKIKNKKTKESGNKYR